MTAGVTVLLYADMRMRREGLDIALQAAAAPTGGGPRSRTRAASPRYPEPARRGSRSRATRAARGPAASDQEVPVRLNPGSW